MTYVEWIYLLSIITLILILYYGNMGWSSDGINQAKEKLIARSPSIPITTPAGLVYDELGEPTLVPEAPVSIPQDLNPETINKKINTPARSRHNGFGINEPAEAELVSNHLTRTPTSW